MNRLCQPLFRREILVCQPKFLELLGTPLRNLPLITQTLPKVRFVQILGGIRIDYREKLDSFDNCELLLLANIKLLAAGMGVVGHYQMIVLLLVHLVAARLLRCVLVCCHLLAYPGADVDGTLIEISLLQLFGLLGFDLVSVALVLVDHQSAV